jgi:hypothetical protein
MELQEEKMPMLRSIAAVVALLSATPASAASEYYYSFGDVFGVRGRVVDVTHISDLSGALIRMRITVNASGLNYSVDCSLSATRYDENNQPTGGDACPFAWVEEDCASFSASAGANSFTSFQRSECSAGLRGQCISASGTVGGGISTAAVLHERRYGSCYP